MLRYTNKETTQPINLMVACNASVFLTKFENRQIVLDDEVNIE